MIIERKNERGEIEKEKKDLAFSQKSSVPNKMTKRKLKVGYLNRQSRGFGGSGVGWI